MVSKFFQRFSGKLANNKPIYFFIRFERWRAAQKLAKILEEPRCARLFATEVTNIRVPRSPYFHLWKRYRWQSVSKRVQSRKHRDSHLNRRSWKTFRSSTSLFLTPHVLHNGLSHRSSPRNIISDIILGRWVSSLAAAPLLSNQTLFSTILPFVSVPPALSSSSLASYALWLPFRGSPSVSPFH